MALAGDLVPAGTTLVTPGLQGYFVSGIVKKCALNQNKSTNINAYKKKSFVLPSS